MRQMNKAVEHKLHLWLGVNTDWFYHEALVTSGKIKCPTSSFLVFHQRLIQPLSLLLFLLCLG